MAHVKTMRRGLALLMVTVALVALVASPASAGPRLHCVANGTVVTSGTGPYTWSINGVGPCLDGLQGNYIVTFAGTGRSDTLGLCGGLVVRNLNLNVSLTILNLRTGLTSIVNETWGAPVTTFPLATPFLIGGGQSGLGTIFTRVLLKCAPAGNSVATYVFDTSS